MIMGFLLRIALSLVVACVTVAGVRSAHACERPPHVDMPGVQEWLRKARASNHPLAGRVVANGAMQPTLPDSACGDIDALFALMTRAATLVSQPAPGATSLVLMGEVHDNPWHHELQAELLRRVRSLRGDAQTVEGYRRPAVVFEHIRADQQGALELFADLSRKGQHLDRPAELFRFLKWEQSGWPDKDLFQPLFRAAIDGQHRIVPGDPQRQSVREVAKQGAAVLGAEVNKRLTLDQPLDASSQDSLLDELEASHCGLMPKAAFTTMADAQRYRDAHLADAVVKAAGLHGSAILYAGNGHVRADRGVPLYLRRIAPDARLMTILLLEVEVGKLSPTDYAIHDAAGRPLADYVVFAPRAERKDPCVEMRARFGAKK